MIVIKRNCGSSIKDSFENHAFSFGDFTIRFTEDEYDSLKDLITDTKEDPLLILQAIIEEGLYSLMGGE